MNQAPDEADASRADRPHRDTDELKTERLPRSEEQPVTDESPRDFIHRRMRELGEGDQGDQGDQGEQGKRPARR